MRELEEEKTKSSELWNYIQFEITAFQKVSKVKSSCQIKSQSIIDIQLYNSLGYLTNQAQRK